MPRNRMDQRWPRQRRNRSQLDHIPRSLDHLREEAEYLKREGTLTEDEFLTTYGTMSHAVLFDSLAEDELTQEILICCP